jgi:mRNA-degrading endonuclease RelE of RelBE toxin-antitoxin system
MTVVFSPHFLRSYHQAPRAVQKAFDKQSAFLVEDLHHPSLRAKKYGVTGDVWQARVNDSWRFYFTIEDDVYHLHELRSHPK